jgi:hypothetical protein
MGWTDFVGQNGSDWVRHVSEGDIFRSIRADENFKEGNESGEANRTVVAPEERVST